ncbi:MAG: amino acid ABC transporter permease [Ruminococcaceae bacterium]|nr:amino acid ABC transporter permease [Oscillospiraceae bacterium]
MNAWQQLLEGFATNFLLFVVTIVLSLPLGLLITLCTMSKWAPFKSLSRFTNMKWLADFKPIRAISKTFVWIIRGTPLMLQLMVVLYAPGLLFNYPISSRMTAAIIAFVVNYAAYFSEIYRGGIESISVGQYEAGQVLGLTKVQVFFKIVLFQVIKRITPPMGNELITLVKDTSLARVIGVVEILQNAERFSARGIIWPLFATGLYFLVFTGILSVLLSYAEKKLDYYKG